ncbi:alpha-xenorhabdolysin family binary toxin subunit B [Pseudomonas sp. Pseusp122]|uniref:alpha-xenorhabdolysin family binary toxin subunit B n=1 Tax=unclassified Pseudomonas TaxID=196821 RepID=UPI0039A693AF
MTIHTIDTPFQLPQPDIAVVNKNRQEFNRQASALSDIYLPVLKEKLLDLQREFDSVDKQALNVLTLIPPVLENDGLADLLQAIVDLRGKEPDDEVLQAIAALSVDLNEQIAQGLLGIRKHARDFDDNLVNLKAVSLDEARFVMPALQKEIDELAGSLADQEKTLAELVERETMVNKLIADVEAISFLDRLKPLISSLEKLMEIDPKNPLIGSVKAGLEGLKNILGLAADAIRYDDLIKLRKTVQEQLDSLRRRLGDMRERRDMAKKKLAQLQAVLDLDVPRQLYVTEIGKLLEALRRFIEHNGDAGEDIVEYASQFINHSQVLVSYLDDLRREWRS